MPIANLLRTPLIALLLRQRQLRHLHARQHRVAGRHVDGADRGRLADLAIDRVGILARRRGVRRLLPGGGDRAVRRRRRRPLGQAARRQGQPVPAAGAGHRALGGDRQRAHQYRPDRRRSPPSTASWWRSTSRRGWRWFLRWCRGPTSARRWRSIR